MALGDIMKKAQPAVMGFLVFIAFIEMVITAVLVSSYNRNDDYPSGGMRSALRFLLFTSVWTIVFGLFYIGAFLKATTSIIASIASHAAFFLITWLFWLAGSAAVTNYLNGGLNCGDYDGPHCNNLNATIAFGWIEFILFTVAFALSLFLGFRSSRNGNGITGPMTA